MISLILLSSCGYSCSVILLGLPELLEYLPRLWIGVVLFWVLIRR